MTYKVDDLSLAYELRQTGMCWKRIAQGFDGGSEKLRMAHQYANKSGLLPAGGRQRSAAHTLGRAELALAYELHCEGSSWRNIATGLGLNPQTLERAIARLTTERDACLN